MVGTTTGDAVRGAKWGYMKVFGIGLNKTGTGSLRAALTELGFNHLKRQPRLLKRWLAGDPGPAFEAADEFDSFDDWPWPLMVPELLDRYGEDARFVLTQRRSPLAWVESLKAHSERTNPHRHPRRAIYGYDYPHGVETAYMARYLEHLQRTRAVFEAAGAQHLMLEACWETGDGWRELCAFLRVPRPKCRFPHANRGRDAKTDPEIVADNQFLIAAQQAREAKKIVELQVGQI